MTLKTITINASTNIESPEVKLAEVPYAGIWQYVGSCLDYTTDGSSGVIRDLNHATQAAANKLAEKLSLRNISIEVLIDPLIPPTSLSFAQMVPLIQEIGENASAAVEPGPGKVILRTWWRGGYAGVDAIGKDATVPEIIRRNLMAPGFSTRAGEWDTGFGLHSASERAKELNGIIEYLENEKDGAGFRFAVPVKMASSAGSPESRVSVPEYEPKAPEMVFDQSWYFPAILSESVEVNCHGFEARPCKA
ncbi:MAG: ATP-binding protein [Deltaproteobacteria bacterium]|nr:ATP-binding protein [Deltaproteobacteria bacterium]